MGAPTALDWSTENCQVGRVMDLLGRPSVVVVLREVVNGVRRFDDMRRHAGLSRQVLTDRLALLVDHGVLRRVPYRDEGSRERQEYRLTEKGFELYPTLVALTAFGARWYADPDGAATRMEHRGCGATVHPVMECAAGHRLEDPRDVAPAPGPGARPATGVDG